MEASPLEPSSKNTFVCECDRRQQSACAGLPFYEEHEGKRFCVLHYPSKDKVEEFSKAFRQKLEAENYNFRGVWFPESTRFHDDITGEADFRSAVFSSDVHFVMTTFKDYADFNSAIFQGKVEFISTTFSGPVTFVSAKFYGETYYNSAVFEQEAQFESAIFRGYAGFSSARFNGEALFPGVVFGGEVDFAQAVFNEKAAFVSISFHKRAQLFATYDGEVNFGVSTFLDLADFASASFRKNAAFQFVTFQGRVNFDSASFSGRVDFSSSQFNKIADFSSTSFESSVLFSGENGTPPFDDNLNLTFAYSRVDKPERFDFHTLALRPYWFVNVDPRRFSFINVEWPALQSRNGLKKEISSAKGDERLFAITCRQLAVNAEENHRYTEASRFRYWAMDVKRREDWKGAAFWRLDWWYWLASGYGERVWRALAGLLVLWSLFALLYMQVGFARWEPRLANEQDLTISKRDEIGTPLSWSRAATYSLAVMTLQKPEPRPATPVGQTLVVLETVFGPFQAALLALALRRKFMR